MKEIEFLFPSSNVFVIYFSSFVSLFYVFFLCLNLINMNQI